MPPPRATGWTMARGGAVPVHSGGRALGVLVRLFGVPVVGAVAGAGLAYGLAFGVDRLRGERADDHGQADVLGGLLLDVLLALLHGVVRDR